MVSLILALEMIWSLDELVVELVDKYIPVGFPQIEGDEPSPWKKSQLDLSYCQHPELKWLDEQDEVKACRL